MSTASTDIFPCAACGKPTHIDDLDAKPQPGAGENSDFTRFECEACYGPGYVSARADRNQVRS